MGQNMVRDQQRKRTARDVPRALTTNYTAVPFPFRPSGLEISGCFWAKKEKDGCHENIVNCRGTYFLKDAVCRTAYRRFCVGADSTILLRHARPSGKVWRCRHCRDGRQNELKLRGVMRVTVDETGKCVVRHFVDTIGVGKRRRQKRGFMGVGDPWTGSLDSLRPAAHCPWLAEAQALSQSEVTTFLEGSDRVIPKTL